ncbi:putative 2-oxoglutarate oxidoreductase alpha subunit [Clostridioides difficile DA00165]|nr:putative 2-oxoglutarate oxidoreductase alpha subunit [Clostridioides difficile DA00165]
MTEAALGQMMEPVEFPEFKKREGDLGWTYDGSNRDHAKVADNQKPTFCMEKRMRITETTMGRLSSRRCRICVCSVRYTIKNNYECC